MSTQLRDARDAASARPGNRLSSLGEAVRSLMAITGLEVVGSLLALAAITLALGDLFSLAVILGVVTLAFVAVVGWRTGRVARTEDASGPTGSFVTARVLLLLLAVIVALGPQTALEAAVHLQSVAVASLLCLAFVLEPVIAAVGQTAAPYAAHLPGAQVRNFPVLALDRLFAINLGATVLCGLVLLDPVPTWLGLICSSLALAATLFVLADVLHLVVVRRRVERRLAGILQSYGATFILYWDAPQGSVQQIQMWLPYLERLEQPFLVVLRNAATFSEVAAVTSRPVLMRRYVTELDVLLTPRLKTAFFVNTSTRNAHMVHYLAVSAIQLNHGDSDKAPSYRRVFRMYDKNFVAGQAAVDRFADHGVVVPRGAFEIVGRPQVEAIQITAQPIGELATKRVLYAPTWYGYLGDSRYSSLPIGKTLIQALLARGCVVTFRPHPWTERTPALARQAQAIDELLRADALATRRPHRFGPAATAGAIIDIFNGVDALVADVSSVVSDFLYSEKPFAITSMESRVSSDAFVADFPLARAGYVLSGDLRELDPVLDNLLLDDPSAELRRTLKAYYLGDFPPERYADGFLDAARRYV